MKFTQLAAAAALALVGTTASATIVLTEGFDDVSTLAGAGWAQQNSSTPGGTTGWFQGNSGVFSAAEGAADAYVAANFNNGGSPGFISNWLFTPQVALGSMTTMAFKARVAGDGLLDTIQVYFSDNGASTTVGDFALLGSYSSAADEGWTNLSFSTASAGATGRFAFRYFVADTSIDGNYIGIDSVVVTVPTPAPLALAGVALAALALTRRKA